jgi:hypothetical protein
MTDPHDYNHDPFSFNSVNHTIVADTNSEMVDLPFEFLAASGKGVLAERGNFFDDSPL